MKGHIHGPITEINMTPFVESSWLFSSSFS